MHNPHTSNIKKVEYHPLLLHTKKDKRKEKDLVILDGLTSTKSKPSQFKASPCLPWVPLKAKTTTIKNTDRF